MSKTTKHLIIQALLLAVWVLILVSANTAVPVLSQSQQVCPEPPFWNTPPTNSWPNYGWPQVKWIDVRIDIAWDSPELAAIDTGVSKWNVPENCSNVRFTDFSPIIIEDYAEAPPDNTVYWQRTDPNNHGFLGATRNHHYADLRVRASRIQIMPTVTNQSAPDYFVYLGSHETGHTFNLGHPSSFGTSIMGGHSNSDFAFNNHGPFACDFFKVRQQYPCPNPSPEPAPTPCSPPIKLDGGTTDSCECNPDDPNCVSPVLIDVSGNGFKLTDVTGGVEFDMRGNGSPLRIAWTTPNSDDAWLALDRNGNGMIDNGQELFGNFTPQPVPPLGQERNGFLALAEYDKANNGGNGDGLITPHDTVFTSLRLWQDLNHNGFSEAGELFSLQALGLKRLELDYKTSKATDDYGNRFRYRAKVQDARAAKVTRWAWDVFLVFTY